MGDLRSFSNQKKCVFSIFREKAERRPLPSLEITCYLALSGRGRGSPEAGKFGLEGKGLLADPPPPPLGSLGWNWARTGVEPGAEEPKLPKYPLKFENANKCKKSIFEPAKKNPFPTHFHPFGPFFSRWAYSCRGDTHNRGGPGPILINFDCRIKICDFGLARGADPTRKQELTNYVVTRWYRAPELLLDNTRYGWGAPCDTE